MTVYAFHNKFIMQRFEWMNDDNQVTMPIMNLLFYRLKKERVSDLSQMLYWFCAMMQMYNVIMCNGTSYVMIAWGENELKGVTNEFSFQQKVRGEIVGWKKRNKVITKWIFLSAEVFTKVKWIVKLAWGEKGVTNEISLQQKEYRWV